MEELKVIAVIGTGLMGGSIGLSCKARGLVERINGFDLDSSRLEEARAREAVTHTFASAAEAVADADLVFLATPIPAVVDAFSEIAGTLKQGVIVTDVGSTKWSIVSSIERMVPPGVAFIGSHPIAGSELEGVAAATPDLFEGSHWILTPTNLTEDWAYKELVRFLGRMGARVLSLDAQKHDEAVALSSHLPQILSSALMTFAADVVASEQGLPLLAAGGFRDMTRIAASSPDLWSGIVRDNKEAISALLNRFRASLELASKSIETEDWSSIREFLARAQSARRDLPPKPGVNPGDLEEVLVSVPDHPGVLAEVTTTLGEAGVNIEDLDIVHSPEGGRGTIHLSVGGLDAARAVDVIRSKGFSAERVSKER